MAEPQKHYAKRKKPVAKDHTLYDSIYEPRPEQANLQKQKADWGSPRLGWGAGQVSFWANEGALTLTVVMTTLLCEYTKNNPTPRFKWANGVACKLYLNKTVTNKVKSTLNIFSVSKAFTIINL